MFSVDGLDFRKYLHGKQKLNIIFIKTKKKKSQKWAFKTEENSNNELLPSRSPKISNFYA